MDDVERLVREWAEDAAETLHRSGYSGINVIEKLLRDPGVVSGGSHRVLWWPKNQRIARVSKAMHQVDPRSQCCLVVRYGRVVMEDGQLMRAGDLVRGSSLTHSDYKERIRDAMRILRNALELREDLWSNDRSGTAFAGSKP